MDPLTNSLAAFTLGRTGLRKLAPHGGAILIAGANLPELDILSVLADPPRLLSFVGGPFHSFVLSPLLAGGLALAIWLVTRKKLPLPRVYALALAGILLRLALDLLPVHGAQSLYPLQEDWFALGILPYMDPWLLLLLIVYAFWPLLSHLVDLEMGVRKAAGQWLAFATILLAAAYGGYRASNIAEATEIVQNHSYANEPPFREQCYPDPFSLVRVHCVVETDSQMVEVDYFTGEDFDATEATIHRKQPRPEWQVAQLQSRYYRQIEPRLRMPHWTVYPAAHPAQGSDVVMRDMVLAPDPYPLFRLRLFLRADEMLTRENFQIELWGYPFLDDEINIGGIFITKPIINR